jgi:hypothetical protein
MDHKPRRQNNTRGKLPLKKPVTEDTDGEDTTRVPIRQNKSAAESDIKDRPKRRGIVRARKGAKIPPNEDTDGKDALRHASNEEKKKTDAKVQVKDEPKHQGGTLVKRGQQGLSDEDMNANYQPDSPIKQNKSGAGAQPKRRTRLRTTQGCQDGGKLKGKALNIVPESGVNSHSENELHFGTGKRRLSVNEESIFLWEDSSTELFISRRTHQQTDFTHDSDSATTDNMNEFSRWQSESKKAQASKSAVRAHAEKPSTRSKKPQPAQAEVAAMIQSGVDSTTMKPKPRQSALAIVNGLLPVSTRKTWGT